MLNIPIILIKCLSLIIILSVTCKAEENININENLLEEEKHIQLIKKYERLQAFYAIPRQTYGTLANLPKIKELSLKTLDELKITKQDFIKRMNQTGVDILLGKTDNNNWLIKDFMDNTKNFHKPVLNINSGIGNWSVDALKTGIKLISHDDKDIDNLLNQVRNIDNVTYLNNFYLNIDVFPKKLSFPDESLSAVIIHRDLNMSTGQEIEDGMKKISRWLSSGDRVYLLALSPYNHNFKDYNIDIYNKNWKEGLSWPGQDILIEKALPMYNQDNPKFIQVMDERPLKKVLENSGFHVIKSDFVSSNYEDKNGTILVDNKAMIGIIAEKY